LLNYVFSPQSLIQENIILYTVRINLELLITISKNYSKHFIINRDNTFLDIGVVEFDYCNYFKPLLYNVTFLKLMFGHFITRGI